MNVTRTNIFRRIICSILIGLFLCNLTGCMLLPKEEEERKVSFVKADELEQYSFISPERMDMEKNLDIPCVYRELEEELMSFKQGNQVVEDVFVEIGDAVTKGTLLASLRTADLDEEIKSLEESIKQIEQSVEQLKLAAESEKKYIELDYKYSKISKVERKQRVATIEDNLKINLEAKEDEMYIQNLRLKEKQEIMAGSRIYAPMDGVISYVKTELKESISQDNEAVIKMINPEKCAFEIFVTEESKYLKEGQTYTVDCDGGSYQGTIMPLTEKDPSYIYLQIKNPTMSLKVGDSGIIHYKADSRKNVLVLPTKKVHEGEGFNFVYVVNDDNIKAIHKVEIGLKTYDYVEIVSGLKDDDLVVNE